MSRPANRRPVPIRCWASEKLPEDVRRALERLRKAKDVQRIAVMPDVHLAEGVCVGTVVATSDLIYPEAVGGDIGCGMMALPFHASADVLDDAPTAWRLLEKLRRRVPILKHPHRVKHPWLDRARLRASPLRRLAERDGAVQLGTLGRGNHFLEFQRDEERRLWLMIHSGSRGMGRAIRDYYLQNPEGRSAGLGFLRADTSPGRDYLHDAGWARGYAAVNRALIADAVVELLHESLGIEANRSARIHCDHNHVRRERFGNRWLWVHRKGAMNADADRDGIIPGSMATVSFHVRGKGHAEALNSSSHGAGRALSREQARRAVTSDLLRRQLDGVWHESNRLHRMRDEAPGAYKDIEAVMRAQRKLTRVVRRLAPVIVYKG